MLSRFFWGTRFNLGLKLEIPVVKMLTLGLKLLAPGLGFSIALLPQVAVPSQMFKSAFEQLKFILGPPAFRFPLVAARLKERHQFPQGTSELCTDHDDFASFHELVLTPTHRL